MNKALNRLFKIAEKSKCRIIGLMSGTSLDGLDIVLCTISHQSIQVEQFKTVSYPPQLLKKLAETRSKKIVSLEDISYLNIFMAHFFGDQINMCLKSWGIHHSEIDLIASHGQTLFHHSDNSNTHTFQIVDGDHIAQKTGIITVSDFRKKHIAVGGQGAPLAVYIDEFLFKDTHTTRVALNLGGIANFTILAPLTEKKESISTDIGPANTLINEAMLKYFNMPYDDAGKVAATGKIYVRLVKILMSDPFFNIPFPKSTGQELFNLDWVHQIIKKQNIDLSPEDLIASLTYFTISSTKLALDTLMNDQKYELIVSGGGVNNLTMMQWLKDCLPNAHFRSSKEFNISASSKEAVLIALLGFNTLKEKGVLVNEKSVHLGKISLPD